MPAYQTPFGANEFPPGNIRCEPNLTVGTEIVRAFPCPSSSETLSDCSDASIGKTPLAPAGSNPVKTSARWLLKSTVTIGRLYFDPAGEGPSFRTFLGPFSATPAERSGASTAGVNAIVSTGDGEFVGCAGG